MVIPLLAAAAGLAALGWHLAVVPPWAESMPAGVWRLDYREWEFAAGDTVMICPAPGTTLQRRGRTLWCRDFPAVLKPVVAVAGDLVAVSDAGLAVNGAPVPRSARAPTPAGLRRIPAGEYAVGEGEVWVISTHHALSLDSRYYGPVPAGRIVAKGVRICCG